MFTRRKKEEEEYIFKIDFLLKNIKSNGLLCININDIFIHIYLFTVFGLLFRGETCEIMCKL
jgi:hypothetical protein